MREDRGPLDKAAPPALASRAAAVVLMLLGVAIAAAAVSPTFRRPWNLANLLVQATPLVVAGVAQTYAILAGDVDLSVGGTVSLTTVLVASMPGGGAAHAAAVGAAAVALGTLTGTANGWLVARIPVEPMVLTLATNVFLLGLALHILPYPGGEVPDALLQVAAGGPPGVAAALALMVVVSAVSWFVLNRTRFGVHLRAVGADPQAAYRAGISVTRVKVVAHAVAGGLAAVAGVFLAGRMGSGDALAGEPFSLDSMTATIAGGTTFSSGQGEVLGTVAGALLISLLSNILNHLGVSAYYQYVFKGLLLLLAVTVGAVRPAGRPRQRGGVALDKVGPGAALSAGGGCGAS